MKVKLLSRVRLFMTPWSEAYQAPLSRGFSRQEYWSGVPLPDYLLLTLFNWGGRIFKKTLKSGFQTLERFNILRNYLRSGPSLRILNG